MSTRGVFSALLTNLERTVALSFSAEVCMCVRACVESPDYEQLVYSHTSLFFNFFLTYSFSQD